MDIVNNKKAEVKKSQRSITGRSSKNISGKTTPGRPEDNRRTSGDTGKTQED